ncbi:MAG TPA: LysR family transcriptional regulator [Lacipirellulaceae bacterium]|jgi:DNA-binding transcriptional LysR family regulator|nr:LysR family transcriptional regulator [Lacipirellulaceae bacterium]
MHLRFLKIFCDIVDMGSFSRAAKANDVSQSNASQVVHHLEEDLGVRLIDRSKRPFVVTPEGKRFHEGCRVIVQRYDDLQREVRSLHDAAAGRLTVASIYSVGLAHMSGYLREFLAVHPQADVRLEYVHPHRVYESVDHGQADLGLVSYPEESPSLAALPWRTEPMVLACYPQHPLTRRHSVPLEALRGEPFVAFQVGLKIREEIDRVLALHRISVRVALEFDNIETIKRAIEIGAGISLLPEPTIAREIESGTLVQVAIEGQPLVRPLGIIHRRDRKISETAQRFIELLQSEASRPSAGEQSVATAAESNGHNGKPSRKKSPVNS